MDMWPYYVTLQGLAVRCRCPVPNVIPWRRHSNVSFLTFRSGSLPFKLRRVSHCCLMIPYLLNARHVYRIKLPQLTFLHESSVQPTLYNHRYLYRKYSSWYLPSVVGQFVQLKGLYKNVYIRYRLHIACRGVKILICIKVGWNIRE